ncbi:MAG: hypothetical protein Q9196_006207 [Gyalolechia fulgens]
MDKVERTLASYWSAEVDGPDEAWTPRAVVLVAVWLKDSRQVKHCTPRLVYCLCFLAAAGLAQPAVAKDGGRYEQRRPYKSRPSNVLHLALCAFAIRQSDAVGNK